MKYDRQDIQVQFFRQEKCSFVKPGYISIGSSCTFRKNENRVSVCHAFSENVDAFFITLKKSAAAFSPTTMYRDYPISHDLFHWESQSGTTIASPTGQRYLSGSSDVLLFVREHKENEFGTAPYLLLGTAKLVQNVGERPIAMTWRLDRPMPSDFFQRASVAAQ